MTETNEDRFVQCFYCKTALPLFDAINAPMGYICYDCYIKIYK